MAKQLLDSGFKNAIDGFVARRTAWLDQLTSGQVLHITVRKSGKSLYCIYKRHNQSSITIESTKETLDWLFRDKNLVLFGGSQTPEEMSFKLMDIKITEG